MLVAQLNCTEETVAPLAFTLEIAKLVDAGVVVCPLPGVTTPAHPTRPELKIAILRTAVSSRTARLLAEKAALNIFQSPREDGKQNSARAKKFRLGSYALWRLLGEGMEGNWTHDANEGRAGGRISTGLKGNTMQVSSALTPPPAGSNCKIA